jgi:uncharacterized membrane protein
MIDIPLFFIGICIRIFIAVVVFIIRIVTVVGFTVFMISRVVIGLNTTNNNNNKKYEDLKQNPH